MGSCISNLTTKSRHSRLKTPPIQRSSDLSLFSPPEQPTAVRSLHTIFPRLPNELLLQIAEYLDTARDLYALRRVNKRLAVLLDHVLSDILLHAYQKSATRSTLFSKATNYPESLVSHLIRLGVDLNSIGCDCGATDHHLCMPALHHAVSHSSEIMVRSLLRHGARINVPYNPRGDNAVHLAIHTTDRNAGYYEMPRESDLAIINMLLGSGGLQTMNDPASLNRNGLSWLSMAVRCCPPRNMTIVAPFLSTSVSVDIPDKKENLTPLHVAVCSNRVHLVAALLRLGADHRTFDSEGMTPFRTACNNPNCELVDLLLCHDATLIDDVVSERGETAELFFQRGIESMMAMGNPESRYRQRDMATRRNMLAKLRKLAEARRNSCMSDTDLQIYYKSL